MPPAHQRHHRDDGVLDRVAQNHRPLQQTLGPGGPDVVLAQHLQHHGARHAHGAGRQVGAEDQAGDQEHAEVAQRVLDQRNEFHRWRPRPPDGRVDHHHGSQPEVGCRQPHDGDRPSHVVGGRVLAHRRVDAHRQGDDQSDEDGQQPELGGDRQSSQHALLDAPTAHQRLAEGPAQEDATDPAAVLHVHRQVQSQPTLEGFTVNSALPPIRPTCHCIYYVAADEAD